MGTIKTILFDYNRVINYHGHLKPFSQTLNQDYQINQEATIQAFNRYSQEYDKNVIDSTIFWSKFRQEVSINNSVDLINLFNQSVEYNQLMINLISNLKQNPLLKIFLFSNLNIDTVKYLQSTQWFASLFDQMIFSSIAKARKPELEFYDYAISKTRCNINEILFIDDNIECTKAATKIGIKSLLYTNTSRLKSQLKILI